MRNESFKALLETYWKALEEHYRRVTERWRAAKRITWLLLMAGALLSYYLLSKLLEALNILRP